MSSKLANLAAKLRDASHVRNHTLAGWRALLETAGLRAGTDNVIPPVAHATLMTTKLTTEAWLERSQTPVDRAAEVRRRLREAPPAAREAFHITEATFSVPKMVILATRAPR